MHIRRLLCMFPTLIPAGQCRKEMNRHPIEPENYVNEDNIFNDAISNFLIPVLLSFRKNLKQREMDIESKDDVNDWSLPELIDTMYVRCLLETNQIQKLQSFLTQKDNECHVQECAEILRQKSKFEELILLYKSHDEYQNALAVMHTKSNHVSGLQKTITYLQQLGENEV